MAADTHVYSENRATMFPTVGLSSTLLKNFAQQQHLYWRVSSYPPTTTSSFVQQSTALEKSGSDQRCCSCASLPPSSSFRFSIFGGPLQSVLRSQSIVQMHMNKMLFGGLQDGPLGMTPQKTVDTTDRKEVQGTTTNSTTPSLPPKKSKGDSSGGEMAAKPDVIHSNLHNDITFQEANHESVESDCESDEYDYDSDSEGEEDNVYFSPELDYEQTAPELDHDQTAPELDYDQTGTLTPNPMSYMSLNSEESGYCENGSDSQGSYEEWSDNESDSEEIDCETNDDLWNSFEQLALSPRVCARQVTETSSRLSANRTDSNDTDTTLETLSDNEGAEGTIKTPQCDEILHRPSLKRVSFKPDSELVIVHHLIAWDYAYRASRKGPWEEYARDRMHFKRRIEQLAGVIEPCLAKKRSTCPVT